jgi:dTDP-glucose pyrophosphorylase
MNLILTMAGKYSRFTKEGYNIPKYLLPWGSRTILSEIIKTMNKDLIFDNIFLVYNNSDNKYCNHIKKTMGEFNINSDNLITTNDTSGQAETTYIALSKIEEKYGVLNNVLIHNIDTILYDRDYLNIKDKLSKYDGYIDLFKSNNHSYSYVMFEDGLISEITEKMLISNFATSGLYGFSNSKLYLNYYSDEVYISEVYKKMISDGLRVTSDKIYEDKNTLVIGTPTEYLTLSNILV